MEFPAGATGANDGEPEVRRLTASDGLGQEDRGVDQEGESAMMVQLNIQVPTLETHEEGLAYCRQVAQLIVHSELNEAALIKRIVYSVPKKKGE